MLAARPLRHDDRDPPTGPIKRCKSCEDAVGTKGLDLHRSAIPVDADVAAPPVPDAWQKMAAETAKLRLRFEVGADVDYSDNMGGWLRGTVVAVNVSDGNTVPVCASALVALGRASTHEPHPRCRLL